MTGITVSVTVFHSSITLTLNTYWTKLVFWCVRETVLCALCLTLPLLLPFFSLEKCKITSILRKRIFWGIIIIINIIINIHQQPRHLYQKRKTYITLTFSSIFHLAHYLFFFFVQEVKYLQWSIKTKILTKQIYNNNFFIIIHMTY